MSVWMATNLLMETADVNTPKFPSHLNIVHRECSPKVICKLQCSNGREICSVVYCITQVVVYSMHGMGIIISFFQKLKPLYACKKQHANFMSQQEFILHYTINVKL